MKRAALLITLVACASHPPVPSVRFMNAPPVAAVNDRRDVPVKPKESEFQRYLHNFDALVHRRVTRALELKRKERARGINALDEVPNSTWFTNRIGVRDVPLEDVASPPGAIGSPEPHKPWTIESSKVGGLTLGFIMRDARGEKFLLKFDPRGYPEAETGTQIIMGRLLWLFGYNVTDDYVVYVRKEDLQLAPDASIKDPGGNKRPLERAELDARLATVEQDGSGTMRALASHWLPGKPLGGHPSEGVRPDDPNDRIPHELRRDLRGAYVLFSWLDHVDLHEQNRIDMYVEDPELPDRHYVKHYWMDFGIGLGFGASKNLEPRYGYEYHFDFAAVARSLLTLGLIERPWEGRTRKTPRGTGMLEVEHYDPGTWKAQTPAYTPIYVADRIDKFWASKIIMRMTRGHIRAAVEAARLTDKRAETWLVDTLIARQRKTAQHWFALVNPADDFAVQGRDLCFKDLSIVHGFAAPASTSYALTFHDGRGRRLSRQTVAARAEGAVCSPLVLSGASDGYTIVRLDTSRDGRVLTAYAHVARDPESGVARVIGIWRQ